MVRYENDCMDCATSSYPCVHCGNEHAAHFYCDECGEEADIYEFDGRELCIDCIKEQLVKVRE